MRTTDRIARGVFRLSLVAGSLFGVFLIIGGLTEDDVYADGMELAGVLVIIGGYVVGRLLAWIIRGFGAEEGPDLPTRGE